MSREAWANAAAVTTLLALAVLLGVCLRYWWIP